jgi:hypothetical protein
MSLAPLPEASAMRSQAFSTDSRRFKKTDECCAAATLRE